MIPRKPKRVLRFFDLLHTVGREEEKGVFSRESLFYLDLAKIVIFETPPPYFWEPMFLGGETALSYLDEVPKFPYPTMSFETKNGCPLFYYPTDKLGCVVPVHLMTVKNTRKNMAEIFLLSSSRTTHTLLHISGKKNLPSRHRNMLRLVHREYTVREKLLEKLDEPLEAKFTKRRYGRFVRVGEVIRAVPKGLSSITTPHLGGRLEKLVYTP